MLEDATPPLIQNRNLTPAGLRVSALLNCNKIFPQNTGLHSVDSSPSRNRSFLKRPISSLYAEASFFSRHLCRSKLTVNLLLSIAQNPSLAIFDLLNVSNPSPPFIVSNIIPTSPMPPPNHLHRASPKGSSRTLTEATKMPHSSMIAQFNLILSKYPQYTKCFTDGSKKTRKTACAFFINTNILLLLSPKYCLNLHRRIWCHLSLSHQNP